LHDSLDLVTGDHGDLGGVFNPSDGRRIQGHADVPAAHIIYAGAQQKAPYHFHLRRHHLNDVNVHHRRADLSHHGTSLPGSDGARATADTDDNRGSTTSGAGEVNSDHRKVRPGPLCPYVSRSCSE